MENKLLSSDFIANWNLEELFVVCLFCFVCCCCFFIAVILKKFRRAPSERNPRSKDNNQLNSSQTIKPYSGFEPGQHLWEGCAPTI